MDWNKTNRVFYLLDTFAGLDERYLSDEEREGGVSERNRREITSGFYTTNLESVKKFCRVAKSNHYSGQHSGHAPQIDSTRIAFLHIDLNCTIPEVAAIDYLWDRLVPNAFILLDDYAYFGYQPQKEGMDQWAEKMNLSILSLPTGQGLLIKP
ncbi:TylF/MycF/NovP-related O-methyltransferase [Pseudomonas sp. NA13]